MKVSIQAAEQLTRARIFQRRVIIWLTDDVPNIPSEDSVPLRYRKV